MLVAGGSTYTAFIDDSGYKEYIDEYDLWCVENPECMPREFWQRNYFVLAAVVAPNSVIPAVNKRMLDLKVKTFGDPTVEVKSTWLRLPRDRSEHYLKPYGITDEALDSFGASMTNVFSEFVDDLKLCACVFDKHYYKDRENHDPFCDACQVILERLQLNLPNGASCLLVADQMEDGLSVTRGRNDELRSVYLNTRRMKNVYVQRFTKVKDLRFRRSCDENLIQLADLAAYNVHRQFVDHGREWDDPSTQELRYYRYLKRIKPNLLKYNGYVVGCGLCKLPNPSGRRWF